MDCMGAFLRHSGKASGIVHLLLNYWNSIKKIGVYKVSIEIGKFIFHLISFQNCQAAMELVSGHQSTMHWIMACISLRFSFSRAESIIPNRSGNWIATQLIDFNLKYSAHGWIWIQLTCRNAFVNQRDSQKSQSHVFQCTKFMDLLEPRNKYVDRMIGYWKCIWSLFVDSSNTLDARFSGKSLSSRQYACV